MSEDRPGTGAPGDGLSEEQVARLLAAAGAAEPTPPDVAARLDGVLADLVAERGGTAAAPGTTAATAPVVALSERRRRPWAPRLLVAAAVLGLVGVGFSVADDLSDGVASSESATAGDAASGSAREEAGAESGAQPERDDAGAGDGAGRGQERDSVPDGLQAPEAAAEAMRLPEVLRITDTASLRAAVRATRGVGGTAGDSELSQGYDPGADALGTPGSRRNALKSAPAACAAPLGPGSRTLVTYEGSPATLVVRRVGERLDGRVYDCDLGLQLDGVEIGPAGE